MSTIQFQGKTMNIVCVDPSTENTTLDGLTPATARKTFPEATNGSDLTLFVIRRTATEMLFIGGGGYSKYTQMAYIAMPKPEDPLYEIMPEELKTAWGADTESRVRCYIDSTVNNASNGSYPSIISFFCKGVDFYRKGITADNWMFQFATSSDATNWYSRASFKDCKFFCEGKDLSDTAYVTQINNNSSNRYIHAYCLYELSLDGCTISAQATSDESCIANRRVRHVRINDCNFWVAFGPYNVMSINNVNSSGWVDTVQEFYFSNNKIHLIPNGTVCVYPPTFFYLYYCSNLKFKNNTLDMPRVLGTPTSNSLYFARVFMNFQDVKYWDVQGNNFDWSMLSRIGDNNSNVYGIWFRSWAEITETPLTYRIWKNNTWKGCTDLGNAYCRFHTQGEVANSWSNYNDYLLQLVVNGTNQNRPMIVENDVVDNYYGRALYASVAVLKNVTIKGKATFDQVSADIQTWTTGMPSYPIEFASSGSDIHIGTLTVNKNHPQYPFIDDYACSTEVWTYGNVLKIDTSNAKIRPMSSAYATGHTNEQRMYVIQNEQSSGHFVAHGMNVKVDTISATRTGSSAVASIKFCNNWVNTDAPFWLAQYPAKGIQITPASTGKYKLTAYVALNGYTSMEELFKRFIVTAEVPVDSNDNTVFYNSMIEGQWFVDDSVWSESNLTKYKLEMIIDVPTLNPVNVRLGYCWYHATGFLLLDPAITLTKIS